MKALDLVDYLPDLLPDEGKIIAHGRRALLLDLVSFDVLRTELTNLLGQEQASRSFERFGYMMGHTAARRLRERYHWDNDREWFSAAPILMNWMGLAKTRLNQLDFNSARGTFFAEIAWRDSFECEQQILYSGPAQSPICWMLTGYLSGYFSLAFGQNVMCVETSCAGTGQTDCVAVVKPISAWGGDARKSADRLRFEGLRKLPHLHTQPDAQVQERLGEALKEARFQALQNQVNPHFFFNTINIIAKLAFLEGASETETMAYALADLMRYSLRRFPEGDGLVTLRDELEHARQYLLIQSTRFRDRLTLHFEIDQAVLDLRVPPLTLQPIIENAFVHGLEPSERPGQLLLSMQLAREFAVVSIQDNGVGINREQLYKLLNREEIEPVPGSHAAHTTGLGLVQVRERLCYYYGERCQMAVESEPGSGTTVRLIFPVNELQKKAPVQE